MSYDSELKQTLAQQIFTAAKVAPLLYGIKGPLFDVLSIEQVGQDSPLELQFKVKTASHGTHYYTLALKEHM